MFKKSRRRLTIVVVLSFFGCDNSEVETLTVTDDDIEEEVPQDDESEDKAPFERTIPVRRTCVFSNIDDVEFYEPYNGEIKLKLTNATYVMPMSADHEIGISVVDVLDERVIKVRGDLTSYANGRFENIYNIEDNEHVYFPYRGFNEAYRKYIQPLTGETGNWPYYDGSDTWLYVENRNHNIQKDDFLNFFMLPGNQFPNVYLPEVTQETIDNEDTLGIQIILSSGENLQVRRNENNGLGRLQYLNDPKTDQANIAMYSGSGESLYSLTLVPASFAPLDGYTTFGWRIVQTNVNHYERCLPGSVSGVYSIGSSRVTYEVLVYESGTFTAREEELSNFANALDRTPLNDDFIYELSLFPGTYDLLIYSFLGSRVERLQGRRSLTVTPGASITLNF